MSKCSELSSNTAGGAGVYPPFTYAQVSQEFKAHGDGIFPLNSAPPAPATPQHVAELSFTLESVVTFVDAQVTAQPELCLGFRQTQA